MLPSSLSGAAGDAPPPRSAGAWLVRLCLFTAGLGLSFCWMNYRVNFFGLYGDARGLSRPVYADGSLYNREQDVKYLLSLNYIPANFDGLFVGCSTTYNWDTSLLETGRVYNLSMGGANISEEKLVAENALRKGKFKVVYFGVVPYLTETHGRRAGGMEPGLYWAGLGSLRLLYGYKEWLSAARGRSHQGISECGVHRYGARSRKEWREGRVPIRTVTISTDPIAVKEYRELVASARASGARIVKVYPPFYEEHWRLNEARYREYQRQMDAAFGPSDLVVDCNAPAYDKIRMNRSNYHDPYHMTDAAVPELMAMINADLRRTAGR